MVRIWTRHADGRAERLRALPPIVPMVFYHGLSRWDVPLSIFDAMDVDEEIRPFAHSLAHLLHDIGRTETNALSRLPELRAVLAALKYALRSANIDPVTLEDIFKDLPPDTSLEITVMSYIMLRYEIREALFEEALRKARPERWRHLMGTIAEAYVERGRNEGLATGRAQGMEQGMAKGEAKVLVRLLERRFGALPAVARERISGAGIPALYVWLDRVIDASALNAVFESDRHI